MTLRGLLFPDTPELAAWLLWALIAVTAWTVCRAAHAVFVEARGAFLRWAASSPSRYAVARRERAELARLSRVLIFSPRPMPDTFDRDPSPRPRLDAR